MKNLFILIFTLSGFLLSGQKDGHSIKFTIDNYDNDTLLIGYYYGNRQLVHDTLIRKDNSFLLTGHDALPAAMYLAIFKPDNKYIQFLVSDDDQHFGIKTDINNLENIISEGSYNNSQFLGYMEFISGLNKKAGEINAKKGSGLSEEEVQLQLANLSNEVKAYQDNLITNNPSSILSKLIKVNKEIEIPEYEGSVEEVNLKRYHYFKNHYFDHLDLTDDSFSRLPFTFQKIEKYLDSYTPQHPDSLIQSIDFILGSMNEGGDFYKFYLSHFLNKYAKSNIVGMDALYVHLIDHYYSKGKAEWIDENSLTKMMDNANFLRPTLIGRKAMDVTTFKEDSTKVNLYSVDSEYTILYIYAYDCGHCKKSTPYLVEFYEKYKDKGVSIFTICSKRETEKCWDYVKEKNMDGFINTVDPYNISKFRSKFDVRQTPKIYILNRDKEILMKGFDIMKIEEIMNEVIEIESLKS